MARNVSFVPPAHGAFPLQRCYSPASSKTPLHPRMPLMAASRGSSNSRRQKPQRRRTPKRIHDPILDDGGVDTTDVNTFVSCHICFNSLIVPPTKFLPSGTMLLNCNVCGAKVRASINDLELISGDKFPAAAFMAKASMQDGDSSS